MIEQLIKLSYFNYAEEGLEKTQAIFIIIIIIIKNDKIRVNVAGALYIVISSALRYHRCYRTFSFVKYHALPFTCRLKAFSKKLYSMHCLTDAQYRVKKLRRREDPQYGGERPAPRHGSVQRGVGEERRTQKQVNVDAIHQRSAHQRSEYRQAAADHEDG